MGNYKLKCTYPGSPDLGYISKPHVEVSPVFDKNDHYYMGSWFNPALYPEFWEKSLDKISILTTEDGVKIFEGDDFYFTNSNFECKFWNNIVMSPYEQNVPYLKDKKIFSSKVKCMEYIEENKPQFSKKDLVSVARYFDKKITSVSKFENNFLFGI